MFTRRALALAAADARVPLDVAATLLCEASLLLERLDGRRVSHARELLDRAASSSRVTRALTTSNADYLRALSCRSWRRDRGEIDVPERVLNRVGDRFEDLPPSQRAARVGDPLGDRSAPRRALDVQLGDRGRPRRLSVEPLKRPGAPQAVVDCCLSPRPSISRVIAWISASRTM